MSLFADADQSATVLILALLVIGVPLYFLPAFIASGRGHQNSGAIFVLNLLLGWSFLGWVVALVWAMTAVENEDDRPRRRRPMPTAEFECPHCQTPIASSRVRMCPGCGLRFKAMS